MEGWRNNSVLGYAMMVAQAIGLGQTNTEALHKKMPDTAFKTVSGIPFSSIPPSKGNHGCSGA